MFNKIMAKAIYELLIPYIWGINTSFTCRRQVLFRMHAGERVEKMQYLWFIGATAIIFLLIIPIRVKVEYRYRDKDSLVDLSICFLMGIFVLNLTNDRIKVNMLLHKHKITVFQCFRPVRDSDYGKASNKPFSRSLRCLYQAGNQLGSLCPYIFNLLPKLRVDQLQIEAMLGTGDAAETGILIGVIYSFCTALFHLVQDKIPGIEDNMKFVLKPNFSKVQLDVYLICIFRLATGHIIIEMIRILLLYSDLVKGVHLNGRTSH
jgi:hypothetical protein